MSDDDRSANERLRLKHIRTLEMLQKVIGENAMLQDKLKKLEGGGGNNDDGDDGTEIHELRELQFKYELKCKQVEDAEAQADTRRLCVQEQADVRIASEQKKRMEAMRKTKSLEQTVQELTAKLAALSKTRPSSGQESDTSGLESELKACQKQLVILQENQVAVDEKMAKREREWAAERQKLQQSQADFECAQQAALKKEEADANVTRRASSEQAALAQQVNELRQVISLNESRAFEMEEANAKLQHENKAMQAQLAATQTQLATMSDELGAANELAAKRNADGEQLTSENSALQSELKRVSAKLTENGLGQQQQQQQPEPDATPVSSAQSQHLTLLKKENHRLRLQIEEMRQSQKKFLRGGASQTSIFPGIQQGRRR
jgi:chromosome segregation ATPase